MATHVSNSVNQNNDFIPLKVFQLSQAELIFCHITHPVYGMLWLFVKRMTSILWYVENMLNKNGQDFPTVWITRLVVLLLELVY